ncbi:MAG: DNA repair protein RecN [Bacillota bacterium]|nr:DNA repair protein RecN [Bacillota bacterium]
MIRYISIRNFATIENVDIDFNEGLNIITGETGAGKSIVIEAISLALGSRADTTFIRSGCDRAMVQMIAEYDDGDGAKEYVITREISSTGRNTCKINDEVVTLSKLSSLCSMLADIHGQYDHQSLLNEENHIKLVDLYKKDTILPAKATVAVLFTKYSSLLSDLNKLRKAQAETLRQKDFMEYELSEILEAHLEVGEDERLEDEISLMQNSEQIFANLSGAYDITMDRDHSLVAAMKQVADMISDISSYSSDLAELSNSLSNLYYEYEDTCSLIRQYRDDITFDPMELDQAIYRLEEINRLKNKHNKSIPELIEYADEVSRKLSMIENSDEEISRISKEILKVKKALETACNDLSEVRKEAALQLQELIMEQLAQLNFKDSKFNIAFDRSDSFTDEGTDIVEFLISTNKGEPLKPLSKIASGGEMSRIMLAFKKIIGDYDEIPTMIFDEVDSGISGIAASIVGRKLLEIAQNHQIICITHLPQVAAYGTSSYRISKHSDAEMTYTTVDPLTEEERISEIARLLGGENITETTIASARELILKSQRSL